MENSNRKYSFAKKKTGLYLKQEWIDQFPITFPIGFAKKAIRES